jgi:hypothetical protein
MLTLSNETKEWKPPSKIKEKGGKNSKPEEREGMPQL